MKKYKMVFFFLLVILSVVSFILISYPTVSNFVNECFNESRYEKFVKKVSTTNDNKISKLFNEATAYNNTLSISYFNVNNDEQYQQTLNSYSNLFDFGDGLIGYVEIPKINIKLAIYHGDNEDVLKKGAAHLEGTSFPIGGTNTHSAISAHSGYPAQRFFDEIDSLKSGDLIYISTLNRKLTYKVYSTDVVEPNDTSLLEIIKNKDIVTLVTCYPYGVNTERLLVHAERVEETEVASATTDIPDTSSSNLNYSSIVFITIAMILIILLLIFIKIKIINKI